MSEDQKQQRLSDVILSALKLALAQQDQKISELLTQALELSMTRNAGGGEFVERRDYPEEIETAMEILGQMQDGNKGGY